MSAPAEAGARFECFGSVCGALVSGAGPAGSAEDAVALARERLLAWHAQFSRFLPDSELSRLNADPRHEVPVSPLMVRLAHAVRTAGELTSGLVDATLIDELETAGYDTDIGEPLALADALAIAPARAPARPGPRAAWRDVEVDFERSTVIRPPGVKLDSGGLAKGMFADVLAETLAGHASFAVNCAGDLHVGGAAGLRRPVNVESPFDGRILHNFEVRAGGVATSGIGRRSWRDRHGRPAHHLLDPSTGRPAFTGIVQATALAPSALMAEIHAKAAILSGPRGAAAQLPHGGVIVLEDGSHRVIEPPRAISLSALSGYAQRGGTRAGKDE
ncbi:MAG TPA: FAD:protein FMN transferase [Solirubrobacteraceae bacterium]